ncbi:hypothetical protein [Tolypothrix sp. FACHB-123]|nr:hypothetical protein [Tolypothrix sp. FACHB-123]
MAMIPKPLLSSRSEFLLLSLATAKHEDLSLNEEAECYGKAI